jgi:23S rRNA pseudouridine1911/1915/1917 synthase
VVNKPGGLVCHPSKHGPWSSLIGACREFLGAEVLHMPSRLDRETSGVVVLARTPEQGSLMQRAIQHGRVRKTYTAIVEGHLAEAVTVDRPIGNDKQSLVRLKRAVRDDGQAAATEFVPLEWRAGRTLARVHPRSGRLHQIRVHAAHLGHPLVGDKLYGPDERHFLTFIEQGFTAELAEALALPRQALHAAEIEFVLPGETLRFSAPLAADLEQFWRGLG